MKHEGFEVLRFVSRKSGSPPGYDYVQGSLLAHYLKYHPQLEKRVLFSWLFRLAECIELYHRTHQMENYDYLCPYNIVVDEWQNLHLLDLGTATNQPAQKIMQKTSVRQIFGFQAEEYRSSFKRDYYSLGRTVQYVMSVITVEPELKWSEARAIRKYIDRCFDDRTYQNIEKPVLFCKYRNKTGQKELEKVL